MGSAVEPPSADLSFAFADRRFVRKICVSDYRFSKIDYRFLLMQIFLTNRRSANADLRSFSENKLQGKLQDPWI